VPEFNPEIPGVFIAGNAGDGGVASTNDQRVVIGPNAGNVHWYKGPEFVCQSYGSHPPALVAVDVNTGAERILLSHGVNKIAAGAGHWFADKILDGQPVDFNVRAFAGDFMAWFPWNGTGLYIRNLKTGADITLSTTLGPEEPIQLFPDGGCLWAEGGTVHAHGLSGFPSAPQVVPGGFGWVKGFKVGTAWWLAYQSYAQGGLVVCHPAADPVGYFWPAPNAFRLDATVVNSIPQLVWSKSSADAPQDIQLVTVDLSAPRFDLTKPMPTKTQRFWYGPNIGSLDMVQIFDDPATIAQFGVFGLVTENILNLGTAIGPNTFEALQANHAFQKLKQAGVPLVIEGGSLTDLEVVSKIRGVNGEVTYFSYSEPLTYPQGLPYAAVLDKVVIFYQEAAKLGVAMGLLEAWPATDLATIDRFLNDLVARDAKPPYFHCDTDYNRAQHEGKDTVHAIRHLRQTCDQLGIIFGLFVNSTVDPIPTDAQHAANIKALAVKIHGLMPDLPHVHLAAWARRVKDGPQDVPNNFGPNGLIASHHEVIGIFGGSTPPDPEPEPETDPMDYTLVDYVVRIKNTKPSSAGGKVTAILLNDRVVSVQPDGSFDSRNPGTDDAYEQAIASVQGLLLYEPIPGKRYAVKSVS